MTKEQEVAIKYLEDMKNNLKDLNKSGYVYAKENIETVLNMLKETSADSAEKDKIIAEKSAEIEKLEKKSKQYFETTTRQAKQFDEEIEKKDKEIEKLTIKNKDLLRKLRNRVRDVKKLQKYSLYKKEFSTLNKQIKEKDAEIEKLKTDFKIVDQECSRLERKEAKQDKIIDLMAEFIENNTLKDVLIENVCLTLKCKNEECHEDNWKECIKQYFETKSDK